jgi:fatty-acyl-CoA synthase
MRSTSVLCCTTVSKIIKRSFSTTSLQYILTKSHVVGETHPPLLKETLGENLLRQTSLFGSQNVIIAPHENLSATWSELNYQIERVATKLLSLGYKPGDRLGIWMPNGYYWILIAFATMRIGVLLVNLNPAYRTHELEHAVNLVGCKGLVILPKFKTTNYIELLQEMDLRTDGTGFEKGQTVASSKLPTLKHLWHCGPENDKYPGYAHITELLSMDKNWNQINAIAKTLDKDDVINIQFTSGTTGLPKAAALTHTNILNNGYFIGERMHLTDKDRLCIPVPLFHCFGTVLGVLACTTHGSSFVLPSYGFDTTATLQAVHDYKCTGLHGVPTMFISYLEHPEFHKFDFSTLRTGIMAGSICPISVMQKAIDRMNLREMTICYGMTETSPVSFQTTANDTIERKVKTIGRVHPHVECKVIDPNTGEILPVNTPGELCTKGYLVMKEYWANPKATQQVIDKDGFMHTGDLAIIDEHGYGQIVGRIKDLIIRGGENISPREVEEFLLTHPKIRDVAVVGVADEKFGEQVGAWIILKDGQLVSEEEIVDFCKNKISHFKIPKYVFFTDKFPMTLSGKVQKYILREMSNERVQKK